MTLKQTALLSLITLAFLFYLMPSMNAAILREARRGNPIRLTVVPEGELGADGWYLAPVRVRATSTPEAVITYRLNGGEVVAGDELLLDEPGEHSIEWNAGDVFVNEYQRRRSKHHCRIEPTITCGHTGNAILAARAVQRRCVPDLP
jgi:hypothetical protein